ncbi:hypothetical protein ACFVY4_09705 [Streptomyces sp. NPDC058299]|uniref:hypothetical protein n=1 Tax=Streptomyces sp. NPDC058299 TaxID=3346435 RepID=UPI0036EEC938
MGVAGRGVKVCLDAVGCRAQGWEEVLDAVVEGAAGRVGGQVGFAGTRFAGTA